MKKLPLIILLLLFALPAWGATYYVNATGGDDSRNTTQAQVISTPWLTIQKCADNTVAGDTCVVAAGTYDEQVTESTDGTAGKYITYVSSTHSNPLANPAGGAICRGFNLNHRDYIKIIGFQITHVNTTYSFGIDIQLGQHNQILHNYIHHTYGPGIDVSNTGTDYNIIRGNTVDFANCPAVDGTPVAGYCKGSAFSPVGDYNLFEYNTIKRVNDYFAFSLGGGSYKSENTIIRNNFMGYNNNSDFPDNTHAEGNKECTGNGTATDPHTSEQYTPSCCTGSKTGTCTARHIDGVQFNTNATNLLFEKNYHDIGDGSDITQKHAFLIRADGNSGVKMRDNVWKNLTGAYYSSGTGFRYYNNTIINSNGSGVGWIMYGELANTRNVDGKALNNLYYNTSFLPSSRPWFIYNRDPANELIADYELWYNYATYYLDMYQAPTPLDGETSHTVNSNPLLEVRYSLPSNSPAKGAGVTITLANGAAAEATTTLVVDDAFPFVGQDWAVPEASGSAYGDTIIIGTNDPVTITAINYSTNTITISAAQTWLDNAAIRLANHNATMDIGAYPYKADGFALTGTWALADGTVTVTPSDASLVRFVEVFEDGIPKGVDYTSPYTVSGIGAGTVTAIMYGLYASPTPMIRATNGGAPVAYNITSSVVNSAGGTISNSQYIESGNTAQFTYTVYNGWKFKAWAGTCGGSGTTTYTTNAITADCTVTVEFEAIKLNTFCR